VIEAGGLVVGKHTTAVFVKKAGGRVKSEVEQRNAALPASGRLLTTIVCQELVRLLERSVERNWAEGILLSGGLDTSILAYLASKRMKPKAFTVVFQNAPAPDLDYSTRVAKWLGLRHLIYRFDESELCEALRAVIGTLDSFDPMEVRNSVVIHLGLKFAKENGANSVITGDGCDELFAGYRFLYELGEEELDLALRRVWSSMHFSSVPLGEALGVEVKLPYLDPEFKKFAMGLDPRLKVREEGQRWGKWILRKAFEGTLPSEILWRTKAPIESGSGTFVLPDFFANLISNAEFDEKKARWLSEDKVVIRDKEHMFYYEVYRSVRGVPKPARGEGKICPFCNSNVPQAFTYCRRCGGHPV
jgi:asparagine synthase (glutamine-hydrolysing)